MAGRAASRTAASSFVGLFPWRYDLGEPREVGLGLYKVSCAGVVVEVRFSCRISKAVGESDRQKKSKLSRSVAGQCVANGGALETPRHRRDWPAPPFPPRSLNLRKSDQSDEDEERMLLPVYMLNFCVFTAQRINMHVWARSDSKILFLTVFVHVPPARNRRRMGNKNLPPSHCSHCHGQSQQ